MADEQGYNGWSNYETWCVSLWIDNDEGTYNEVREMASGVSGLRPRAELADGLKVFIEDLAELTCPGVIEGASFVADMFQAALSEVDWYEIAENILSERVDA